jgi:hypothetical protein
VFDVKADAFAQSLFQCLGCVVWLGGQLQQLMLPGDSAKAAAALQDLQEQQQQLQQALEIALWRLHKLAAVIAVGLPTEQLPALLQQHVGSSRDISTVANGAAPAAASFLCALASSKPAGPLNHKFLDPAGLSLQYAISAGATVAVLDRALPAQLQEFGSALWSALPQPRCCNSAACTNLGSVSEAKLVAGKASRCSRCRVAK